MVLGTKSTEMSKANVMIPKYFFLAEVGGMYIIDYDKEEKCNVHMLPFTRGVQIKEILLNFSSGSKNVSQRR